MRNLVKKHFGSVIVLDKRGELNYLHNFSHFEKHNDPEMNEFFKKVAVIVNMKGFYRGSTKSEGKWMRDEDVIRILEENPEWLETNVIARDYGI